MKVDDLTLEQLVPWFLMACYAYYEAHNPIMEDCEFDLLTARLKDEWENIVHPHKSLITPSHLDATTGYDIEYPTIVKYATMEVINESR
jgi:NAD-dependent DNA ligase